MTQFKSWIAGLASRQSCASHAPEREAGMLAYYNEELEQIGADLSCRRLPGERDDAYRRRLAAHMQALMLQLEALHDRVLNATPR